MKLGYIYAGKVKGSMELGTDPYTGLPASLIFPGRIVSESLAGDYIDIDVNYLYNELLEFRAQVTDWTRGNEFKMLYTRLSAALSEATGYLQGVSFISRAESAINLYGIRAGIFETNLRAGGQTITYVRGVEICIASPAFHAVNVPDPTVNITDLRVLQVETQLNTDVAPTTVNVGIYFDYASASAIGASNFHEMRLGTGVRIFSRAGVPNDAAEPYASAPEGSICLRSDPGAKNEVVYVKHNTTWTALSD